MNTSFGEAGFIVDNDRARDRPAFDYNKKERRDSIGKHLRPEGGNEGSPVKSSEILTELKQRDSFDGSGEVLDLHNTSKNDL
jgi:hypothetical protein